MKHVINQFLESNKITLSEDDKNKILSMDSALQQLFGSFLSLFLSSVTYTLEKTGWTFESFEIEVLEHDNTLHIYALLNRKENKKVKILTIYRNEFEIEDM